MHRVLCTSCRSKTEASIIVDGILSCNECKTLSALEYTSKHSAAPSLPPGCEAIEHTNKQDLIRSELPDLYWREPNPVRPSWHGWLELTSAIVFCIGFTLNFMLQNQPGLGLLTIPGGVAALVFVYSDAAPRRITG